VPRMELEEVLRGQMEDRCTKRLRVASQKRNRPSVPTIGLVNARLKVANDEQIYC